MVNVSQDFDTTSNDIIAGNGRKGFMGEFKFIDIYRQSPIFSLVTKKHLLDNFMQIFLSMEGSLVDTRDYLTLYHGGTPVKGSLLAP